MLGFNAGQITFRIPARTTAFLEPADHFYLDDSNRQVELKSA
jgi:hypothetical protein